MKNLLIALFLFAATSQVAQATQARLIALGLDELDNEGSYYIEDSRNIFLNASKVNDYGDMAIVEWGGVGRNTFSAVNTSSTATVYQDNTPKAQGGVLMTHGDFTYGAYFGNESNTSSFLRIASTSNAASLNSSVAANAIDPNLAPTADNQLDLFFGHNMGEIDWGANFVYLNNEDESASQEDKAMALRLGAQGHNWDAHANISLQNEAKNTVAAQNLNGGNTADSSVTQEFDGSLGLHLGGSYEFDFGHLYGFYKKFEWDQKDSYDYSGWTSTTNNIPSSLVTVDAGKTGTSEGSFNVYSFGWGKTHEVNDGNSLFTNLQFKKTDIELKLAQTVEVNNTIVPVTFGYEHVATDWLTVRGSVTQNLYGRKDNKNFNSANAVVQSLVSDVYGSEGKGTISNSTRVHAGATLTFGNLQIDGVVGTESAGGGGYDASSDSQDGILSLDNAMATVAATYRF